MSRRQRHRRGVRTHPGQTRRHGAAVDTLNSGIEQTFKRVKGIEGLAANLSDATRMLALVEEAVKHLGRIDILVNDFPWPIEAPLTDADTQLKDLLQQRSAFILSLCRSALPHLKKSPSGRIISIGFLRSVFAADSDAAFAKAEQDLAAITTAFVMETGDFGITANYVQPGAIMTPVSREVFRKNKALRDFCIARSAVHRLGESIDVARVVSFLAGDEAAFVNGTGITVDGGRQLS
ncbi:MAG: SDR family oxidoreductase [Proteobacteria bacterium]|nr:SDR family oxidoreductase [Pseudomonadota bacterium]MDA1063973.1 SDR family oxidoreductase [Pseudomonadota bacterium]